MKTILLESIPQIVWALVFLLLNAVCVAGELSLIKLRFSHFNPGLLERLRAHKRLSRLFDEADVSVKILRFGEALCCLGLAAALLPPIAAIFAYWLGAVGPGLGWVPLLLAFLIVLLLYYLLGELLPRGLGLQYPLASLKIASPAIRVLGFFGMPLIRALTWLSHWILRVFRAESGIDMESLDVEAQIELLGEKSSEVSLVTQKILRNTLMMRNLEVSDVLLPRHQVQYFNIHNPLEENIQLARRTGHTRFPLCDGDLDKCIGLIHIKDLFRQPGGTGNLDLRRIKRNILRLGPEERLEDALQKLLRNKMHMALVIDEFRGTEGVLTLERILEQLVGDIQDEFDTEEANILSLPNGDHLVSGLTPVHEVEEHFQLEFEEQDVSTFGGLITTELGRIPDKGERLTLDRLAIIITEVDEKRVIGARVRPMEPAPEDETED